VLIVLLALAGWTGASLLVAVGWVVLRAVVRSRQESTVTSSPTVPRRAAARRRGGGLDLIASAPPAFRNAFRGYDRSQVDEHVMGSERELALRDALVERLLSRLGAVTAERDVLRADRAGASQVRETVGGLHRLGEIMVLAAEDAAEVREQAQRAAAAERAHARREADLVEEHTRVLQEAARTRVWEAESLRSETRALRAEAVRDRSRAVADRRAAQAVREAAEAEAAAAAARSRAEQDHCAQQLTQARDELARLDGLRARWTQHLGVAQDQLEAALHQLDADDPAAPAAAVVPVLVDHAA
jgi:hypothetical protein